jgi:hypothetical protein
MCQDKNRNTNPAVLKRPWLHLPVLFFNSHTLLLASVLTLQPVIQLQNEVKIKTPWCEIERVLWLWMCHNTILNKFLLRNGHCTRAAIQEHPVLGHIQFDMLQANFHVWMTSHCAYFFVNYIAFNNKHFLCNTLPAPPPKNFHYHLFLLSYSDG